MLLGCNNGQKQNLRLKSLDAMMGDQTKRASRDKVVTTPDSGAPNSGRSPAVGTDLGDE